jgi:hypothetical protein
VLLNSVIYVMYYTAVCHLRALEMTKNESVHHPVFSTDTYYCYLQSDLLSKCNPPEIPIKTQSHRLDNHL